jgi:transcriptional regulator with XRE-family HTH domain
MGSDPSVSTSEFVRRHRVNAGLSVGELAARAGVSPVWLERFEAGQGVDELTYDGLLALVRATQPPRPAWWDEGHEHDLHLGQAGVPDTSDPAAQDYWARIEAVRRANRSSGAVK